MPAGGTELLLFLQLSSRLPTSLVGGATEQNWQSTNTILYLQKVDLFLTPSWVCSCHRDDLFPESEPNSSRTLLTYTVDMRRYFLDRWKKTFETATRKLIYWLLREKWPTYFVSIRIS